MKGASKKKNVVYIGIGSNLGNRRNYLDSAIEAIERSPEVKLLKSSGVSNTEPVDNLEQTDFLNQVVSVETQLQPHELLKILQDIEESLGRERTTWKGPRTIDLDILLFGRIVLEDADLMIPHPELLNRSFFIRQILEIAPDMIDPTSQQSLSSFLRGRENQGQLNPGEEYHERKREQEKK